MRIIPQHVHWRTCPSVPLRELNLAEAPLSRHMNRLALLIILGVSTALAQGADPILYLTPYAGIERYSWEEFKQNGESFLEESGPRYSLGILSRFPFFEEGRFSGVLDIKGTYGVVPYDGSLMLPEGGTIPYSTKTGYIDFRGSVEFGYSFRLLRPFLLTPLAGISSEYWIRDLDRGGSYGYTERYFVISTAIGLRLRYAPRDARQLFVAGSIGFPHQIRESFLLETTGGETETVYLHPGIRPQYKVEIGGTLSGFSVTVSYESWTLSESAASNGFYQPKSVREEVAVNIGYTIPL